MPSLQLSGAVISMGKKLAGRPRKQGVERYAKNGRETRGSRAEDATRVVLETRMRHLGAKPDERGRFSQRAKEIARDPAMGSPLGKFKKWEQITTAQHEAGEKFAIIMRDYLAISTAPRHTPKCVEAGMVGGGSGSIALPEDDETIRKHAAIETRARGLIKALEELDRFVHNTQVANHRSHTAIVWGVCISEDTDKLSQYELGALREGLNAIGRQLERVK